MVYIRKVMECLPKANNTVLHALLKVFVKIFKDNCVDTQKATVELWGPVLLCRANVHDTAREVPAACSLLRFMIENYEAMFPQSADKQVSFVLFVYVVFIFVSHGSNTCSKNRKRRKRHGIS